MRLDIEGLKFYDDEKDFLENVRSAVIKKSETKLIDALVAKNSVELKNCI